MRVLGLFLWALLLTSCRAEYHPYDTRIKGGEGINAKNIKEIEGSCRGKQSITFAVISDTQRWYDQTEDAVKALNNRSDIDFVLHAGDIADFGLRVEFERQRDILNRLDMPYVAVIGNHDCLATGDTIFQTIFGEFNFAFTAGDIRFICLNTNALEFEPPISVPDLDFVISEAENFPKQCSKSVALFHAAPDSDQFDSGTSRTFHGCITQLPELQCAIHGHGHSYRVAELFNDGLEYIMCDNIEKRSYLLFTINQSGCSYERILF